MQRILLNSLKSLNLIFLLLFTLNHLSPILLPTWDATGGSLIRSFNGTNRIFIYRTFGNAHVNYHSNNHFTTLHVL